MKWKVIIEAGAAREIREAARWYGRQRRELKLEFLAALEASLRKVAENPRLTSARRRKPEVRWTHLQRFPYRLVYEVVEANRMIVVASVLHTARDDSLWQRLFEKGD